VKGKGGEPPLGEAPEKRCGEGARRGEGAMADGKGGGMGGAGDTNSNTSHFT